MFDSVEQLSRKLAATGYFIDPVMTHVVYLAARLQKPLLLEGPAGSGKTRLATALATAAGTHVERLQCYRGVTEEKAIGRFDESLQRLYMEFSKGQHENWQAVQANLKGRDFFRPGPLMRALDCERPCVLLVDELDKVDNLLKRKLLNGPQAVLASAAIFTTSRRPGCHSPDGETNEASGAPRLGASEGESDDRMDQPDPRSTTFSGAAWPHRPGDNGED